MKTWYYKIEDKEFGSIIKEELLNQIDAKEELTTSTLVRDEEMNIWVQASSIDGLLPTPDSDDTSVSKETISYLIIFLLGLLCLADGCSVKMAFFCFMVFIVIEYKYLPYFSK